MPLSPRPSRGMFSSPRPFLWWSFPSLAPAICSKLRQKGISVSLRLLASHSTLITRYITLSHVISPNRIQSHRIARLGWQKDLTLQHEHDSWAGPPPDRPRQTSASPAESMSPRSLTYWHTKGGPNLWQARRPPQPQREKRNPLRSLAKEVELLASLLVADGLLHFSVIERSKTCILAW